MGRHNVDIFPQRKTSGVEVQRLLRVVESAMEGNRHFHQCPGPDGNLVLLNEWTDYRSPVESTGSAPTSPGD